MKNKLIFFLFLLSSLSNYARTNQYIIVTFESKRSIDREFQNYFWIAPIDSIKDRNFYLYPLHLVVGEYSKDNLDNCIKGDTIDIFNSTNITRLNFDDMYEANVETLLELVIKNRVKVQTINVSWELNKKAKNKINIYITPILGDFCRCFHYGRNFYDGKWIDGFKSLIYLPMSNFSYNQSFWETQIATIVKFANYNHIDYTSYLNYPKGVQEASHKE